MAANPMEPRKRSRPRSMARRFVGVATAALIVGTVSAAFASAAPAGAGRLAAAPVPGTGCTVFPADNIWNTDISTLPVNPKSGAWLASMNAGSTNLHPDFGKPPYGLPFAVVDDTHATVHIKFQYASESDPGPYPFGPDIPIEQGSDRHALMINKDTCVLYELFAANWNGGSPKAGSGAIFDLGSNALRTDGWTSADAAGLPIFPGLVRLDEVQAGFIGHAIRFTADLTDCTHIWPARHDAGTCNPNYPPMGARFRLKSSFSLKGFSRNAKVILKAMKTYGLILADNGSNWYFQGTEDSGWSNSLLDQLKTVPASQFEAIDESACMVNPNSAQAACP
ncbi:MAG TPA: hypothetical protein VEN82_06120 [Actinomycetota bacterium]|nr:hypothetical protein [Actinomycetota bacterium]